MDKVINLRNHIDTMITLVSIRHSINTADDFYDKENDYCDEISPLLYGFTTDFYEALVTSKFRKELEDKYGKFLFDQAECSLKTFNEEVIPQLQEENKLSSKYDKLIASAKIPFDGEERTLSQMAPYTQSKDRNIRKDAAKKVAEFFSAHKNDFDEIYDKLVKVRTEIAHKLGFKNYVELAYARLRRLDYNAQDVAGYRKQVLENIVPLHSELRERQAKRLGIDKLKFYDEPIKFNSGNADPHGDPEWILNSECKLLLTKNCRNTREIALTAYNVIDIELNQKITMVSGEQTSISFVKGESLPMLAKLLNILTGDKYGYEYSDITILSLRTELDSILHNTNKLSGIPILREKSNSAVLFTTAKKFKGLESRVVIIIDIDEDCFNDEEKKRNFYIACSRATQKLLLFINADDKKLQAMADAISSNRFAAKGKIAMKTQSRILELI